MKQYLDLLQNIIDNGCNRDDRTGTGTRALFGTQTRYNLIEGFPAVTTKKLAWKSVVSELLWFIEGSGDERHLAEILYGKDRKELTDKTTIWSGNATAEYWQPKARFEGDLGRVYGVQWRNWRTAYGDTVDQLEGLINGLKDDPYGRRHILTAWNPGELDKMALPPCHAFAQFFVSPLNENEIRKVYMNHRMKLPLDERHSKFDIDSNGNRREGRMKTIEDLIELNIPTQKLSCQMYQRSGDAGLGIPFNIASYSLFTHMIAQICGYEAGDFIHTLGDCHIYNNHFDAVKEQLTREPLPLPNLWLNPDIKNINDFTIDDIKLLDYQSHSIIKMNMAV